MWRGATIPAPLVSRSRRPPLALMLLGLTCFVTLLFRRAPEPPSNSALAPAPSAPASLPAQPAECVPGASQLPDGFPAMLTCHDARTVVAQVRAQLAAAPIEPAPLNYAHSVAGWLDPHGLWSAAPDAPPEKLIERHAGELIAELERSPRDSEACSAAETIGVDVKRWVDQLRIEFDAALARPSHASPGAAFDLVSEGVFQDDPVTLPARTLSRELGERVGAYRAAFPGARADAARVARERLFPDLTSREWSQVLLAAAVRAYVPAVDPHGQWAPLDEEWSLYAADVGADGGVELWGQMVRTPLGVRVVEDPAPPLEVDDLVLAISGVPVAGMSVEQIEQLSRLEPLPGVSVKKLSVLRRGESSVRELDVPLPDVELEPSEPALSGERVAYGAGDVLVVTLTDVPDGLGSELSALVSEAHGNRTPQGILLDLRGNGGGSTDGASGAIGVFLPGAPSFPLKRRAGRVEIQYALAPPAAGQWSGPVAVLVDGYTASAAEMIAGAIASYERGAVIGARTFGKGCIQEYFDDRSGVGVLRLTTMLFALPDGSPLQGVGLTPSLQMKLESAREREASLPGSMPTWSGPDVRDVKAVGGPSWPSHRGRIGVCEDRVVCRALRRLGDAGIRRTAKAVRRGLRGSRR